MTWMTIDDEGPPMSPEPSLKNKFTIPVGLCLVVYSINDINSQAETAEVDMGVAFFLRKSYGGKGMLKHIASHIFLVSAVTSKCRISRNAEDLSWIQHPDIVADVVAVEVHVTATFKVGMEFASFPFDVQDLLLRLYCDDWVYIFESATTYFKESSDVCYTNALVAVPTVLVSQEWGLDEIFLYYDQTCRNETMFEFSQINVHFKLVRKGEGFLYKFVLVLLMISLASWLPLGLVDVFTTSNMLTYEVGLLFTVASYRITFQSYLPITSSVSIIEWYTFFLFFFILLAILLVILCAWAESPDDINWKGRYYFVITVAVLWFLGQLGFGLWLWRLLSQRNNWRPKEPRTVCLAVRGHKGCSLKEPSMSYEVEEG